MYKFALPKLREGIILFIKDVMDKDESLKYDLNFYLDFYQKVYSDNHFYKLVNGLIGIKKMVLMRDSKFILYDPIFSIIELPNKVNILNYILINMIPYFI